jgi:hypothetical protein
VLNLINYGQTYRENGGSQRHGRIRQNHLVNARTPKRQPEGVHFLLYKCDGRAAGAALEYTIYVQVNRVAIYVPTSVTDRWETRETLFGVE